MGMVVYHIQEKHHYKYIFSPVFSFPNPGGIAVSRDTLSGYYPWSVSLGIVTRRYNNLLFIKLSVLYQGI